MTIAATVTEFEIRGIVGGKVSIAGETPYNVLTLGAIAAEVRELKARGIKVTRIKRTPSPTPHLTGTYDATAWLV